MWTLHLILTYVLCVLSQMFTTFLEIDWHPEKMSHLSKMLEYSHHTFLYDNLQNVEKLSTCRGERGKGILGHVAKVIGAFTINRLSLGCCPNDLLSDKHSINKLNNAETLLQIMRNAFLPTFVPDLSILPLPFLSSDCNTGCYQLGCTSSIIL